MPVYKTSIINKSRQGLSKPCTKRYLKGTKRLKPKSVNTSVLLFYIIDSIDFFFNM